LRKKDACYSFAARPAELGPPFCQLETVFALNEVFLRVYKDPKYTLVAACDSDLLGETFREGKLKLEVKPDFYRGVQTTIMKALDAIDAADIANLVGEAIVQAAVKRSLVDPSAVLNIGGVPHVQIVRM
jgi:hypothetical protein